MDKDNPKYYHIEKCICCGKDFKSTLPLVCRQRCNECAEKANERMIELYSQRAQINSQIMHEKALKIIETCRESFRFSDIMDAVNAIGEMERISPRSFQSASEVVTAIGLYHEGFFFKINHSVLQYSIDFYMPDDKICLEIDGDIHDVGNTRFKDGRRDIEIRNELGGEWEVVRISNNFSDKFPFRVGNRALEMANRQRELRKKNQGHLPRGYSKSVDAYYAKVFD